MMRKHRYYNWKQRKLMMRRNRYYREKAEKAEKA